MRQIVPAVRSMTLPCALLAALLGAAALPARAENLIQAFGVARSFDPRYKAARFEFEAAAYAEPQALAALLPTVGAELTHTDTRQNILSSNNAVYATGMAKFPTDSQTLTLTQPIFKLSAWLGYGQARTKVKQAALTFAAAEQDLMLRLATAYLGGLAGEDAVGFAVAERDAIKRQLDLVQGRYKGGLVAIAGLHDARARHAIKEADVVAAQNELDDRRQALREMTGTLFPRLAPLREQIALDLPQPNDIAHWVEVAARQNLLVEARRQSVEVAQQEIGKQRAGHAPVLDAVVTTNRTDTGGSVFGGGSNLETAAFMFRLNIPIFSGGLTSAQTGEAMQRYYASQEDLERDLRQVERQTRAAFQGVTGGAVRVEALAQGVVSTESARNLRQEGYKAGMETMLQVLDAERDLYAAKRDSAKARYDFLLNRLRLKQAVGTLSEADLEAVSRLLQ
jgi:outer membrane protein